MIDSEFGRTEVPLIAGELYGMRGFNVRKDGTLGPLHRETDFVYGTGVQTASCDLIDKWLRSFNGVSMQATSYEAKSVWKEELHAAKGPAPQKECLCGFYAYFDNAEPDINMFMTSYTTDQVNGIVRATGRCIVGDLGFRAEKIEIVGLVCDYPSMNIKTRFPTFMREVMAGMANVPIKLFYIFLAIHILITIADAMTESEILDVAGNATVLLIWSYALVQLATLGFMAWITRKDLGADHAMPSFALARKIKEQYPDVKFFSSLEAAREHFPLTKADNLPS